MGKYKVGEELLIVENKSEDVDKLLNMTGLEVNGDFAKVTWAVKILKVDYDKPNVTLTYRNIYGKENKVFAVCRDIENFDQEKVLEKALLKAFEAEISEIATRKNLGLK